MPVTNPDAGNVPPGAPVGTKFPRTFPRPVLLEILLQTLRAIGRPVGSFARHRPIVLLEQCLSSIRQRSPVETAHRPILEQGQRNPGEECELPICGAVFDLRPLEAEVPGEGVDVAFPRPIGEAAKKRHRRLPRTGADAQGYWAHAADHSSKRPQEHPRLDHRHHRASEGVEEGRAPEVEQDPAPDESCKRGITRSDAASLAVAS